MKQRESLIPRYTLAKQPTSGGLLVHLPRITAGTSVDNVKDE